MPEYSDYLEGLDEATDLDFDEIIGLSKDGDAKRITPGLLNPFRGNWTNAAALPSTGGRFTGGVPGAGDEYHLTNGLSIGSNDFPPGTIAKSKVNSPASISDWVFYSMQAIF